MPRGEIGYSVGNEHSPTGPFGRVELVIAPGGAVRLEHITGAGRRAWIAAIRPEALAHLRASIARSPFPEVPMEVPVPDAEVRTLTIDDVTASVWPGAARQPVYAAIFTVLDAIAGEVSGGAIRRTPPAGPSLVTSIRSGR